MRLTSHTHCFRSEAGAAGTDTRGMLRQHQFSKVELVSIIQPEHSKNELERMLESSESILKDLEISGELSGDLEEVIRKALTKII